MLAPPVWELEVIAAHVILIKDTDTIEATGAFINSGTVVGIVYLTPDEDVPDPQVFIGVTMKSYYRPYWKLELGRETFQLFKLY